MQTNIYILSEQDPELKEVEIVLTLKHFISHLKKRIEQEKTMKKGFFEYVLGKLEEKEALAGPIDLANIDQYKDELGLVYSLLLPVIADENETLWGLGVPLTPTLFYGTDAFYHLLSNERPGADLCELENQVMEKQAPSKLIYTLILERLYGFKGLHNNEMLFTEISDKTGLPVYLKIHIDGRFTEIKVKGELPQFNLNSIREGLQKDKKDWGAFKRILPLSLFRFEGFTIITITDVTATQAIENIKSIILNRTDNHIASYFDKVVESLKTLIGEPKIEFGLIPVHTVNGIPVFHDETYSYSLIMSAASQKGVSGDTYVNWAQEYLQNPHILFFPTITKEDEASSPVIKNIKEQGVESFALIPISYNSVVVGFLEIYTKEKELLRENLLGKLELAKPYLAQLLEDNLEDFNAHVEAVVKEKFTSLQPAVQWKFNEVAWHYLKDNQFSTQKVPVEGILFKEVYPLYGAVDIRNSTIERNNSLTADLQEQFALLCSTLEAIKEKINIALTDELIFKCKQWAATAQTAYVDHEQMHIKEFLEGDVHPFLQHFKDSHPSLKPTIQTYFDAIDEETGSAFSNRRALEASMQTITSSISQYLDLWRVQIQESYPCYFEKFRTDGVEYDIYLGQSIAPTHPFNYLYLKNVRLWQLTAMATIATITKSLLPQLEKPLLTTQLIFVHSNPIDISFRNDERRFDVEGTYNIRYQVIKKRIDKVNVKGTHERLTQPNKIALVYFNSKDIQEYVEHIYYLQEQKILGSELEYLDLEELQGVNGLKALRISI